MKKILILGRQNSGEKNDIRLLAANIISNITGPYTVSYSYFEDTLIIQDGSKCEITFYTDKAWTPIEDYSLIVLIGWSHDKLYSDLAGAIAWQAGELGIRVWNSELVASRSMSKVSQIIRAAKKGVIVPKTLFSLSAEHSLRAYDNVLSFPVIAKDPTASRGRKNYLVKDKESLEKILKANAPLMHQEFIKNDSSDVRVIMAGGQPVFAMRRASDGDSHLNNISAGGSAEMLDLKSLPKKLLDDSRVLSAEFKRELCGIDFIYDTVKNHFTFLEINLTPQLVNGVFVDEKMIAVSNSIMETLKG